MSNYQRRTQARWMSEAAVEEYRVPTARALDLEQMARALLKLTDHVTMSYDGLCTLTGTMHDGRKIVVKFE